MKVVREKEYATCDQEVKSLTHLFTVLKTLTKKNGVKTVDKVRIVYNATKVVLNEAMFAPWFSMPTVDNLFRSINAGIYIYIYMTDCDEG